MPPPIAERAAVEIKLNEILREAFPARTTKGAIPKIKSISFDKEDMCEYASNEKKFYIYSEVADKGLTPEMSRDWNVAR